MLQWWRAQQRSVPVQLPWHQQPQLAQLFQTVRGLFPSGFSEEIAQPRVACCDQFATIFADSTDHSCSNLDSGFENLDKQRHLTTSLVGDLYTVQSYYGQDLWRVEFTSPFQLVKTLPRWGGGGGSMELAQEPVGRIYT